MATISTTATKHDATTDGAALTMDIDTEAIITTTTTTTTPTTTSVTQQESSMGSISREIIQALQDEHYLDRLTEEPLRTLALEATRTVSVSSTDGTTADESAATATATVRVEVLEIGLRSEMLKRLQSIMMSTSTAPNAANNANTTAAAVGEFWKSALRLCWHLVFMSQEQQHQLQQQQQHDDDDDSSMQRGIRRYYFDGLGLVRKIPFLLLEDVLDSLPTLEQCRQFWNDTVQPSFDLLFHPQVIWTPTATTNGPCWLPFLKISNKYIRRAAHYPSSSSSSSSATDNAGAVTSCTVMSTLCNVFPLAEKSATRPWGSYNADHVSSFETLQEFENNNIPGTDDTDTNAEALAVDTGNDDDGAVPDYSFYESFWKLQEDLSNPNAIKVADFMQRLKTLITAMESTDSTIITTTASSATTSSPTSEQPLLYQPKYLTSSRLLSIQLSHDVDFRRHILCQVLVVIHHLSHQVPVLQSKLEDAQQRAMRLLSSTQQQQQGMASSSSSLNMVDVLQSLLKTSELQWRSWKKNKCVQDLDQRQSEPLTKIQGTTSGVSGGDAAVGGGRKRKRLNSSDGLLSNANRSNSVDDDDDELDMTQSIRLHGGALQSISRRMRGVQPSIQDHLSDYVEALDPDAGIEAEYHPKTNALFCWRAVRLLISSSSASGTTTAAPTTNGNDRTATSSSSTSRLQDFAYISPSGDFEALVREMYKQKGVHIPGESPIYQQDDELNEIEEEKEDKGAKNTEHNSPKEEDHGQADQDEDKMKMEENGDKMDVVENGENKEETEHKKKNPAPRDDGNDSEPVVPMAGVVKEERNHRQPDDERSQTGEIDSLHPITIVASNMPNGKGGQEKDIVALALNTAVPAVNGGASPPLRGEQQKGTGRGSKDAAPPSATGIVRGGHQRGRSPPGDRNSPGRGDDHSKAFITNPPQGDNRGGGGPRGGRLSPLVHQTAAPTGPRRNHSENDLPRRSTGPQQAHAVPPVAARGGGGGGGPIPPDRRVDHAPPPDRRHDVGPPPGQRRSGGGGGGGGPFVDRGPHVDRDDQRRGGGGGGARTLTSNHGPRGDDRREQDRSRMEDRRGGAADDDRRGSGGEDRRGGGGGGGGGDDRARGGDRGDWRPRGGGGGGGRDQSRSRHGRR